jgi:hypothetical protein
MAASEAIVVQVLPHPADGVPTAALRGTKPGTGGGTTPAGAPAGSFGNAALPVTAVTGLAAALLGGSDDQLADFSEALTKASAPLPKDEVQSSADKPVAHALLGAASGETAASSFGALVNTAAPNHGTTANQPAPAQPTLPQQPGPLPHLPTLQIMPSLTKAAGDGGGRFNIQLHPQELGRVRIELDIDHDGHVTAAISAAHPETLDLLRRDASTLQQALTDAGLKSDGNALSFNLQGDGQNMGDGSGRSGRPGTALIPAVEDPLADEPAQSGGTSLGAGLVAMDIRI